MEELRKVDVKFFTVEGKRDNEKFEQKMYEEYFNTNRLAKMFKEIVKLRDMSDSTLNVQDKIESFKTKGVKDFRMSVSSGNGYILVMVTDLLESIRYKFYF